MPNHCFGTLKVIADDELLNEILKTVHGTGEQSNNPFDFNKIIPMPDYIYRGNLGDEEMERYGKNSWYYWSDENWGTKWNSCDTEYSNNCFTFWTAWSPCSPVIQKLSEMFPDARFEYSYKERDIGFRGYEIYENGSLIYKGNKPYQKRVEGEPLKPESVSLLKNFIVEVMESLVGYPNEVTEEIMEIRQNIMDGWSMGDLCEEYDDFLTVDTEIVIMAIALGWNVKDYIDDSTYLEEDDDDL